MTEREKVLELLNVQLKELDNITTRDNGRIWEHFTVEVIKKYLGEKSTFLQPFNSSYNFFQDKYSLSTDISRAKEVIRKCIQYIELNGVQELPKTIEFVQPEPPQSNFINRISDTALWTIIGVGIPGLISIGIFFGNMYSDKQNFELRQENRMMKDSLSSFKSSVMSAQERTRDTTNTVRKKLKNKGQPK
ncbi:hypothetical protein [Spirosoma pollinicola]|uniref:Uncharacterized protein n=1 Tax=Spirosoma pollinicola TaxID=2057025 RepID=A0A2K8YZ53_9BACT|nr:hypothetical protein [Spirosoma pollinicola]AUD02917.1 hypothetical protein CWM47_14395 [Spirosoma pollinicola]